MSKKIKVLFGADLLLNNFCKNSSRSGIFFVVNNILLELKKNKNLDISLYFTETNALLQFLKLYKDNKDYCDLNIFEHFNPKNFVKLNKINEKIKYYSDIKKNSKNPIIKGLANFLKTLIKKYFKFIENKITKRNYDFSNVDLYFSPVFAAPEYINKNDKIEKFIVLYDATPLIHKDNSFNSSDYNNMNWFFTMKQALDMNTNCLFISEHTKKDFIKFLPDKINTKKSTVIPLSTARNFKHEKNSKKIKSILDKYKVDKNKRGKYIFSLCTLEPRKNLTFTIKCFIEFIDKNKIDDLCFYLGGGYWDSFIKILENEIDNLDKYKDKIVKLGYVDDEDLNVLYSNSLFFTYISLYEGFGMPPLEAMSSGVPVITSNVSSLPEVVGDAAIKINPTSREECIKAFEDLYYNEKIRQKYIEKGMERAKLFNWKKTSDIIVNKFKDSIKKMKHKKALVIYGDPLVEKKTGTEIRMNQILTYLKKLGYDIDQFIPVHIKEKIKGNKIIDNVYTSKIHINPLKFFYYRKIKRMKRAEIEKRFLFENIFKNNGYTCIIMVLTDFVDYLDKIDVEHKCKRVIFIDDITYKQIKYMRPNTTDEEIENLKKKEIKAIEKFDNAVFISKEEIDIFKNKKNSKKIEYIPHFMENKNIVKKDSYKYDLLYVASGNICNIEASKWFLSKVYPKLKDLNILFVGSISQKIENKAKYKNIKFVDFMENLDDAYNNSKTAICPMFSGTGLKIKVVEALAYGKPVVCNKMAPLDFRIWKVFPDLLRMTPINSRNI